MKEKLKPCPLNMNNHERYIINEEEIALLDRQEGITGGKMSIEEYMKFDKNALAQLCRMKDVSNDLFTRRYEAAREVIDIIARAVGIDPGKSGFWLYAPDEDGTTPITDRIESWLSRSGEKAKLKRRIQELEQENAILRSIVQVDLKKESNQ